MRWRQRKLGWIGVDVGTSTVNIAQLVRSKDSWKIAASAIVPRQTNWQVDTNTIAEAGTSVDELRTARSLQQGYRGRNVAAALPMALCDLHRFDSDLARDPNAWKTLRQTIETTTQQPVDGLQCDFWSAPAVDSQPAWSQALTVPRSWTDQLCKDVSSVGWRCEAIDGLPLAIARAVNMIHPSTNKDPVAALDWGNGRATLCFIEAGQPTYVRCLKDCGLRKLIDALVENLNVTDVEAQRLLEDYGLSRNNSDDSSGEAAAIAELVHEVLCTALQHAVDELQRSISHFQYLRRCAGPKRLYLLGGGGMIRGLQGYLTQHLQVRTRNWQLPGESPGASATDRRDECLLATAIALSALAWEAP